MSTRLGIQLFSHGFNEVNLSLSLHKKKKKKKNPSLCLNCIENVGKEREWLQCLGKEINS